jgi:hypothetical protein
MTDRKQTNLLCGSTFTRANQKLQEILDNISPDMIKLRSRHRVVLDNDETFIICVGEDSTRGRRVDRVYVDMLLSIEYLQYAIIPCLYGANTDFRYGDSIEFY